MFRSRSVEGEQELKKALEGGLGHFLSHPGMRAELTDLIMGYISLKRAMTSFWNIFLARVVGSVVLLGEHKVLSRDLALGVAG